MWNPILENRRVWSHRHEGSTASTHPACPRTRKRDAEDLWLLDDSHPEKKSRRFFKRDAKDSWLLDDSRPEKNHRDSFALSPIKNYQKRSKNMYQRYGLCKTICPCTSASITFRGNRFNRNNDHSRDSHTNAQTLFFIFIFIHPILKLVHFGTTCRKKIRDWRNICIFYVLTNISRDIVFLGKQNKIPGDG